MSCLKLYKLIATNIEEQKCEVCGVKSMHWAVDEDDRLWCTKCMDKWEEEHNENWCTGEPKGQGC